MKELLKRMGQESTWRGLLAIVTAFGITVKPDMAESIIASGVALIGLINVIKND